MQEARYSGFVDTQNRPTSTVHHARHRLNLGQTTIARNFVPNTHNINVSAYATKNPAYAGFCLLTSLVNYWSA